MLFGTNGFLLWFTHGCLNYLMSRIEDFSYSPSYGMKLGLHIIPSYYPLKIDKETRQSSSAIRLTKESHTNFFS